MTSLHSVPEPRLNAIFSALGDQTRRDIVARLATSDMPINEVAAAYDMSLTAVSRHVQVLHEAGLISVEKRGRSRHCRLEGYAMRDAVEWLAVYQRFWLEQFDSLDRFLTPKSGG